MFSSDLMRPSESERESQEVEGSLEKEELVITCLHEVFEKKLKSHENENRSIIIKILKMILAHNELKKVIFSLLLSLVGKIKHLRKLFHN